MRDVFEVMVTRNALGIIGDKAMAGRTKRAVERAMAAATEGEYQRPRTVVVHDSPLAVHIDPDKALVLVITNEHGFPLIDAEFVDEVLPFCTRVSLA